MKKEKLFRGKTTEKLFGFVYHSDGEHEPLIKNSRYYIMCSNGQTFEHVRDNT